MVCRRKKGGECSVFVRQLRDEDKEAFFRPVTFVLVCAPCVLTTFVGGARLLSSEGQRQAAGTCNTESQV